MIQAEFVSIDRYNTMPNKPKDKGKKKTGRNKKLHKWMEGCIWFSFSTPNYSHLSKQTTQWQGAVGDMYRNFR